MKINNDLNIEVGDWLDIKIHPVLDWEYKGRVEEIREVHGFLFYEVRFAHKWWMVCSVLHYDVVRKTKDPNLLRRFRTWIKLIIDRS